MNENTISKVQIGTDEPYNISAINIIDHDENVSLSAGTGKKSIQMGEQTAAYGDYSYAGGQSNETVLKVEIAATTVAGVTEYIISGNGLTEDLLKDNDIIQYKDKSARIIGYSKSGDSYIIQVNQSLSPEEDIGEGADAFIGLLSAIGLASHAEGNSSVASGQYSHAEGLGANANGGYSHAEGYKTNAIGYASHTEGHKTSANFYASHAEGENTVAAADAQHVQGKNNIIDKSATTDNPYGTYAHIVGNGTKNQLSNAHTLDWEGNAWFAGDIYVGGTGQYDENAKKVLVQEGNVTGENAIALGSGTAIGDYSIAEGKDTLAGCKGYYIAAIDPANRHIYLYTGENAITPTWDNPSNFHDETFTSGYQILDEIKTPYGNEFSVSSDSYYHWVFAGNIFEVSGNRITYSEDNSLDNTDKWINENNKYDGQIDPMIFFVPAQPNCGVTNVGLGSHAEGWETHAAAQHSHSEGYNTIVAGRYGHAEGNSTRAGFAAHAEGEGTLAQGLTAHSEGSGTQALGNQSHAEGQNTVASSRASHAEGSDTTASGVSSHAEGGGTVASGTSSHAEGRLTYAVGSYSHAEGGVGSTAGETPLQFKSDFKYPASTYDVYGPRAEGLYSHAQNSRTLAVGTYSHAGGAESQAYGNISYAYGSNLKADGYLNTTIGCYNKSHLADNSSEKTAKNSQIKYQAGNYAFAIGNGTSNDVRSNAFSIKFDGTITTTNTQNSTGADYAEYFEWSDGNPEATDRIGRFVSLYNGNQIKLANFGDEILGVISGQAAILGDAYEDSWNGMYDRDIYGRLQYEEVEVEYEEEDEEGNPITRIAIETHIKLNPNYDPTQTYIPRSKRPEWAPVGLLGKLVVIDDGSCVPGGKCACGINGIATASETGYHVLKRLDDTHIQILLK